MTTPEWQREIAAAQLITHLRIGGKSYSRVPHLHDAQSFCRDCACRPGQFHVIPCVMERCPACMGQALSCCCEEDRL